MGQYHVLANLDKKEYVDPSEIDDLLKMWEWDHTNRAMQLLLCPSAGLGGGDIQDSTGELTGRWVGDRVVVLGDYADQALEPGVWKGRGAWLKTSHRMVGRIPEKTRRDILKAREAVHGDGPKAKHFYDAFKKRTAKKRQMLGGTVTSIPGMSPSERDHYDKLAAAWKKKCGWTNISPLVMQNAQGFEITPEKPEGENPPTPRTWRVRLAGRTAADHEHTEVHMETLQRRRPGTPAPSREESYAPSWKCEALAENEWVSNALRFATRQEAIDYGVDLMSRWMAAKQTREVQTGDPVTHRFVSGKLIATKQPEAEDRTWTNPPSWIDAEKP